MSNACNDSDVLECVVKNYQRRFATKMGHLQQMHIFIGAIHLNAEQFSGEGFEASVATPSVMTN